MTLVEIKSMMGIKAQEFIGFYEEENNENDKNEYDYFCGFQNLNFCNGDGLCLTLLCKEKDSNVISYGGHFCVASINIENYEDDGNVMSAMDIWLIAKYLSMKNSRLEFRFILNYD